MSLQKGRFGLQNGRFRGRCFRGHDPRWSFDPLSGEGARLAGGRFNAPGTPALYLSLRLETVVRECQQGLTARMSPLTLCEYDVDCEPVADLASAAGRKAQKVTAAELACPWLDLMMAGKTVPSQRLAARLAVAGMAGALVPSFAPGAGDQDVNLVLWRWGGKLPAMVRVFDPEGRLPMSRRPI